LDFSVQNRLNDFNGLQTESKHAQAFTAEERVMERSLASQMVEALILATCSGRIVSREDLLDDLLDKGAH
jgi:hypothetical protein